MDLRINLVNVITTHGKYKPDFDFARGELYYLNTFQMKTVVSHKPNKATK